MFKDRRQAGGELAKRLKKYSGRAVVCAIARGGVVLGAEIAKKLSIPLGVVMVRKIGHPENPEYAVGVVSERFERGVVSKKEIVKVRQEIKRRKKRYLCFGVEPRIKGKTVILVDDGAATGLTFLAAIRELRDEGAREIVAALPVASEEALEKIKKEVEGVVLLEGKMHLGAVGAYYEEFGQVSDNEVLELLKQV